MPCLNYICTFDVSTYIVNTNEIYKNFIFRYYEDN